MIDKASRIKELEELLNEIFESKQSIHKKEAKSK